MIRWCSVIANTMSCSLRWWHSAVSTPLLANLHHNKDKDKIQQKSVLGHWTLHLELSPQTCPFCHQQAPNVVSRLFILTFFLILLNFIFLFHFYGLSNAWPFWLMVSRAIINFRGLCIFRSRDSLLSLDVLGVILRNSHLLIIRTLGLLHSMSFLLSVIIIIIIIYYLK